METMIIIVMTILQYYDVTYIERTYKYESTYRYDTRLTLCIFIIFRVIL